MTLEGNADSFCCERLPTCEYGVPEASERGVGPCGDPAIYRCSWDGGQTWLHACEEHAQKIWDQEEQSQ